MAHQFDYLTFPVEHALDFFTPNWFTGTPRTAGPLDKEIKRAIDRGFQWVRTEGDNAIFEIKHVPFREPIEREALEAGAGIIRQHNLLSTATEQDKFDTIQRLLTWWNHIALPALYPDSYQATPVGQAWADEIKAYARQKLGEQEAYEKGRK